MEVSSKTVKLKPALKLKLPAMGSIRPNGRMKKAPRFRGAFENQFKLAAAQAPSW
jgi:hypothetical protein